MPIPGRHFRDLRAAADHGDHDRVVRDGRAVVAALDADPTQRGYTPAALAIVGAALVARERYVDAVAWLEQGLGRLAGTPSAGALGGADWYHRLLADLYLLVGRWADAARYLDWLSRPAQPLDNRLAATRGLAALAGAQGRFDDAHLLVNAAADLARRRGGRLVEALVGADRALVVAAQGRLAEAVHFADEVAPCLATPGRTPAQAWANQEAAALLTTMARELALGGDLLTARRYLIEAEAPVTATGRAYWRAHLDLAKGVTWREDGEPGAASAPLFDAAETFERLGAAPSAAVARLEQARLADVSGHDRSARELYRRAAHELAALPMPRQAAEARARLGRFGPPPPHPT